MEQNQCGTTADEMAVHFILLCHVTERRTRLSVRRFAQILNGSDCSGHSQARMSRVVHVPIRSVPILFSRTLGLTKNNGHEMNGNGWFESELGSACVY